MSGAALAHNIFHSISFDLQWINPYTTCLRDKIVESIGASKPAQVFRLQELENVIQDFQREYFEFSSAFQDRFCGAARVENGKDKAKEIVRMSSQRGHKETTRKLAVIGKWTQQRTATRNVE